MMETGSQHGGGRTPPRPAHEHGFASKPNGKGAPPNPEVEPKAQRRRFGAKYKAQILEEIDKSPGEMSAILRREGLYSSHVHTWRKQRRQGTLKALAAKKRGPKGKSAEQLEVERLRKENMRLKRELEKANVLIDAQKKLAIILGVDLPKLTNSSEGE